MKKYRSLFDFYMLRSWDKDWLGHNLSWYNFNNTDFVGMIVVEKAYMPDGYRWCGQFFVDEKYRLQNIGTLILKYAMDKYNVGALCVYKDNMIALDLYQKVGFNIYKENAELYYLHYKPNWNKDKVKHNSFILSKCDPENPLTK